MAQDPNVEQPQVEEKNEPEAEAEVQEAIPLSQQILKTREQWEEIKKALDAVMPLCDQINRLKDVGNKPNKLKNTTKKRNKQLKAFKTKLKKLPDDDEHVVKGMEIAEKLATDLNAEELAAYSFDIRRYTQSIVKVRRELMDKYKAAKKEEEQQT